MPLLTNAQQNMGFSLSSMIRTGVLSHGTLRDGWVIYEGQYHNQMVCVIQAPMYQLVSRDAVEIFSDVG